MNRKEINIDIPEEHFSSPVLKKGLLLFQRNLVEISGNEKHEYTFLVGRKNKAELHLKLQKNLVLNYECSCGTNRCEHLCAALFFLRKENYLLLGSAKRMTSGENERIYKSFEKQIKNSAEKFSTLQDLIDISSQEKDKEKRIYLLCSIIIFCLRNNRFAYIDSDSNSLDSFFKKQKIKEEHADYLFYTVKESLRSQRKFETEAWYILLPYLSPYLSRVMAEDLKALFLKRKERPVFPGNINRKTVALHVLNLSVEKSLFEASSEYFIALALVGFAGGRIEKSFQILDKGFSELKRSKNVSLGAFIQFILKQSEKHAREQNQIKYLKEFVMIEPFISPGILQKIDSMMGPVEKKRYYSGIVSELMNNPNAQQKIVEILFHEKSWDELIAFIRRRKLKFSLLNKVALEMYPETSATLLTAYPELLVNAMNSAGDGHYRNFIFEEAKKFLLKLELIDRKRIVEQVLSRLGGKHHLAADFLKLLNLPA